MEQKTIKIAQFSTHESNGGAAKASVRLNYGLKKIDSVQVQYFVKNKNEKSDTITLKQTNNLMSAISNEINSKFIENNKTALTNTPFTFNLCDSILPYLNYFDIINLHWVENFISLHNLYQLTKLNKPIVWTLHDMKPFTGGCHYNNDCYKFMDDCSECHFLKNDPLKITYSVLKIKQEIFENSNITIVAPSIWLSNEAKKSKLFFDKKIYTIPYGVDTDIFYPTCKNKAKIYFGISTDSIVLTFGVMSHTERRKGFNELYQSVKLLKENYKGNKELIALFFGNDGCDDFPIDIINLGHIGDQNKLSLIYSAADIFILPSLEDNLPNTILESLACQTPIIAFDTGGAKDIINNTNGSIVKKGSIQGLYESIHNMILDDAGRISRGKNGRELIVSSYQLHHQANQYKNLFQEIIDSKFEYKNNYLYDNKYLYPMIDKILNQEISPNKDTIDFSHKYNNLYTKILSLKQSDKKYIIYGYGTIGKTIRALIPDHIIGYVDKNDKKNNPLNLKYMKYDKIIISVLGREAQIVEYLIHNLEIPIEKIIILSI